jgi:hypothetical protein
MGKHSLTNISGHAWIIEHMKDGLSVIGNVVEDFGKWCSHGISLMTVFAFSQVWPMR